MDRKREGAGRGAFLFGFSNVATTELCFKIRQLGSPIYTFVHGQGSEFRRCMAAWISCCDSESLTHTTLKRDLLPPCWTQSKSPDLTCLVMPDSKAPLLPMVLAMASCVNG